MEPRIRDRPSGLLVTVWEVDEGGRVVGRFPSAEGRPETSLLNLRSRIKGPSHNPPSHAWEGALLWSVMGREANAALGREANCISASLFYYMVSLFPPCPTGSQIHDLHFFVVTCACVFLNL